jgi:DNA end-binding protein Ku
MSSQEENVAARAIWKGVIKIGKSALPVKLYSAVQDHAVHFRLLHKTDHQPVRQEMINPESGKEVDRKEIRRAFPVGRNRLVMLEEEELEKIQPEESRDIEVERFVDREAIDHRWYERAYYLGPDGNSALYFAAAEALRRKKKEGLARWVMRKKEYVGALLEEDGYLMLIVLRFADEVVDADALPRPSGRVLQKRELAMARQLIDALAGTFDPSEYRDEYRERVMDLIKTKSRGGKVKVTAFRPRKTKDEALSGALEASLAGLQRRKSA